MSKNERRMIEFKIFHLLDATLNSIGECVLSVRGSCREPQLYGIHSIRAPQLPLSMQINSRKNLTKSNIIASLDIAMSFAKFFCIFVVSQLLQSMHLLTNRVAFFYLFAVT